MNMRSSIFSVHSTSRLYSTAHSQVDGTNFALIHFDATQQRRKHNKFALLNPTTCGKGHCGGYRHSLVPVVVAAGVVACAKGSQRLRSKKRFPSILRTEFYKPNLTYLP